MLPLNRHLGDAQTQLMSPKQKLDIESKSVDGQELKQHLCDWGSERFASTLSIPKAETRARRYKPIEHQPHKASQRIRGLGPRLGQGTASHNNVMLDQSLKQQRNRSRIDGHVRIHVC